MLKISQRQLTTRWDFLSDEIKEAVTSEQNADIVWRVCQQQHLSEDKILKVATLVGDVLYGFIHAEDLAQEIKQELGINQEIADIIVNEVDRKILRPFKGELEKNYQPPVEESEELAGQAGGTSGVLDLREKPSFEIVENKIDLSKFAAPQGAPVEFRPEAKVEKEEPAKEEIKKEIEIKTDVAGPKEILAEKSNQGRTPTAVGEKKEEQKEPGFVSFEPAVAPQAAPQEEAPLMIHKEEEIKPLAGKWKSLGGMFGFLQKRQPQIKEETAVKAQFEIGGEEKLEEKNIFAEIKSELKPEVKPQTDINMEVKPQIKVVDYSAPAPAFAPGAIPVKPFENAPEKMAGELPENLPIVKEDLLEIKSEIKPEAAKTDVLSEQIMQKPISEIKPEPKIEEFKPQVEPKNSPEETIDLGMFK